MNWTQSRLLFVQSGLELRNERRVFSSLQHLLWLWGHLVAVGGLYLERESGMGGKLTSVSWYQVKNVLMT